MRYFATVSTSVLLLLFGLSTGAKAVTIGAHSVGGLMQQPTSQYYHLVYGGTFEVATDKDTVIGRFSYVERPKFVSAGFVDQETFATAAVGTKLTKKPNHGLYAFFGAGQASGYIRPEDDSDADLDRRGFKMRGAMLSIEYGGTWNKIFGSVSHQTLIGFVDKEQSDIQVAWPYQFFLANIGMRL